MRNKISGFNVFQLVWAVFMAVVLGCKSDPDTTPSDTDNDTTGPCEWDEENDLPEGAGAISLETAAEAYICPLGDQDWYAFSVSSGSDLLKVDLTLDAPVSPINPVYTVFASDGVTIIAAPDTTESADINQSLSIVHSIEEGDYYIRVLDQASDGTDNYHPYSLTVTGLKDKDTYEPDDTSAGAAAVTDDDMEGYISYRGDEDWYTVDSPARGLLRVSMSVEDSIAPSYRILDADENQVTARPNDQGLLSYDYYDSLVAAGTYYIVVYHNDPLLFDTETPYTLTVAISSDPDQHEDNNTPDKATPLSTTPIACGADWSAWAASSGYLASSGDIDWYKVDVTGSTAGLIEVDVTFDDPDALPENMEPLVRLVYPVAGENCTTHQDCQSLSTTCTEDIECSKLGNTCLNAGVCAGSGSCMPGGNCGATLISQTSAEIETSNPDAGPAPILNSGKVRVAAPLFGTTTMYIAVEDYQGDAQSTSVGYTIQARIANDTDTREPSEVYMNGPAGKYDSVWPHLALATAVPVHTCTGSAADDCCSDASWIEGAVSYTYDQDWYRYDHPCPGLDCMVRIRYLVDAGPVDALMMIYQGESLWYDSIIPSVSDTGDQVEKSGACGGLAATDTCLYAYSLHNEYYFSVRDTIYVSEGGGDQNYGTWDWNKDQQYRFCVEKVADTCVSPCKIYEDTGCGPVYVEE